MASSENRHAPGGSDAPTADFEAKNASTSTADFEAKDASAPVERETRMTTEDANTPKKSENDYRTRPRAERRGDGRTREARAPGAERSGEHRDRADRRDRSDSRDHRDSRDRSDGQGHREHRGERGERDHRDNRGERGERGERDNRGGRDNRDNRERREHRGERDARDTSERQERPRNAEASGGTRTGGAAGALIELDKDLMKLLVRRAVLVSRIRAGKDHAATPEAIQAEKAVRTAFEANALSFSKDPRFTRQLFTLLQDLSVLSKEEAQEMPGFTLSPQQKPVKVAISGPVSDRSARMWLALAACSGLAAEFLAVPRTEAAVACVKALNQAGASIEWMAEKGPFAAVAVTGNATPRFAGKTLYAGEDPLTLYLICFMAAQHVGVTRLTGGSALKSADLAGLRHTLPLLGARLAHVIPRSQGLPATLECSGALPDSVIIPEDLPLEGVCALLLAPLVWNRPLRLDLSRLPAAVAATALTELSTLFAECGAAVDAHGAIVEYSPGAMAIPAKMPLPLDPALSAYLLALPAFTGGTVSLRGPWPAHLPEAHEALQVLAFAGVQVSFDGDRVSAALLESPDASGLHGLPDSSGSSSAPAAPNVPGILGAASSGALSLATPLPEELDPSLLPLAAAVFARNLRRTGNAGTFPFAGEYFPVAQGFFSRLKMELETQGLRLLEDAPALPAWTCPDAFWGMGLALASFVRPGVRLANPDMVSEAMPAFWGIFNGLPEPKEPGASAKPKENADAGTTRRRIIAG